MPEAISSASPTGSITWCKRIQAVRELPRIGETIAKCPKRTVVVGGGFAETGTPIHMRMVASQPVDRGDKNNTPDDGWTVRMYNESGGSNTNSASAYAVCEER